MSKRVKSPTVVVSHFGQRMRASRKASGLSQGSVADKLGVVPATIGNWERDATIPGALQRSPKKLAALEEILGSLTGLDHQDASLPEPQSSEFGEWLRTERTKQDLSVPELAKKAELTPPAIYNIENGKIRNPQQTTREKIVKALKVRVPQDVAVTDEREEAVDGLGALTDFEPYAKFADWPQCAGVYVLYDISERVIYVGQAAKIAVRLKDHEEKFWYKKPIVVYGSYIEVTNGVLRDQLEKAMIRFLKSNAVINQRLVDRSSG